MVLPACGDRVAQHHHQGEDACDVATLVDANGEIEWMSVPAGEMYLGLELMNFALGSNHPLWLA